MDLNILKIFDLHYKEANKKNKLFAKKIKKIEPIKDSYYAYALDMWNAKDELLKCVLASDIYKWIEESPGIAPQEQRLVLLYILHALSMSCLREEITNHALALTAIRSGIGDNGLEREISVVDLQQLIDHERKRAQYEFSRSIRSKHLVGVVDAIFVRILLRLQDEEYFYISLVDGSYWCDLAETINATNISVSLLTRRLDRSTSRC